LVVQILSILTAILTLMYVGLLLYLKNGWSKLKYFHAAEGQCKTTVSVLIAARNEEDSIKNTIEDVLAQDYPKHLVQFIIVDDHSTDRTSEIVKSFANQGVKLIVLNEKEALNSYKKKAISEAIKKSDGDLIVTTDADCRMGSNWLKTIVSCFESGDYKLISSPVIYFEEKSLFEELQSLEFLFLISLGASGIGNGMPTTCNGANLAYRRDVFLGLNGFQGIDNLASGDDELFMHKVAVAYPKGIAFCKSRDAIVNTHAKPNLSEFIQQRKRWASKSTSYKNKWLVALGVSVWIFNLSILLNLIAGLFNPVFLLAAVMSFFLKASTELLFMIPVCRFEGRLKLLWYQPFLSLIHIIYLIYIGLAGNSGKYIWKGRMVR
jgi:cellulose synthase/poly-beta-1,6-N-acetylglucosamine synthase-like glycosyltransferase